MYVHFTSSPSQTHGDGIHSPGVHSKCLGLHWPDSIDRFGSKKNYFHISLFTVIFILLMFFL